MIHREDLRDERVRVRAGKGFRAHSMRNRQIPEISSSISPTLKFTAYFHLETIGTYLFVVDIIRFETQFRRILSSCICTVCTSNINPVNFFASGKSTKGCQSRCLDLPCAVFWHSRHETPRSRPCDLDHFFLLHNHIWSQLWNWHTQRIIYLDILSKSKTLWSSLYIIKTNYHLN